MIESTNRDKDMIREKECNMESAAFKVKTNKSSETLFCSLEEEMRMKKKREVIKSIGGTRRHILCRLQMEGNLRRKRLERKDRFEVRF